MTSSKTTKRALISSVIALVLCFAMLLGTTFAWFTDSVSTGKNQIVAGNLDVELEYASSIDDAGNITWTTVDENTVLFSNVEADGTDNLWEPGHTEVVYLRIRNAGTLALKYRFSVRVTEEESGINMAGRTFYLSDYLVFGQVVEENGPTIYASREAVWAAVGNTLGLRDYVKETEQLLPGNEQYVALAVYMPTTVGNEANHLTGTLTPNIELGVTLTATQTPYEEDSFGSDYDALNIVPYPNDMSEDMSLNEALATYGIVFLTEDVTADYPVPGEDWTGVEIEAPTHIYLNDHTLTTDYIDVSDNVVIEGGTLKLSWSDSIWMWADDTTVTLKNVNLVIENDDGLSFNMDGNNNVVLCLQNVTTDEKIFGQNGAILEINGGNYSNTISNSGASSQITILDGTFGAGGGIETSGILTIQDGTFNSPITVAGNSWAATINGGTFTSDRVFINDGGSSTLTINGGIFTSESGNVTFGGTTTNETATTSFRMTIDGATINATGTLTFATGATVNFNDGTINAGTLIHGGGTVSPLNVNGGTVNANTIALGSWDKFNLSGGAVTANKIAGKTAFANTVAYNPTFTMTGGTLNGKTVAELSETDLAIVKADDVTLTTEQAVVTGNWEAYNA